MLQSSCLLPTNCNGKNVKPRQKSATASDKMKIPPAVDRRLVLLVIRRMVKPFPNTMTTERSQPKINTDKFMFSVLNSLKGKCCSLIDEIGNTILGQFVWEEVYTQCVFFVLKESITTFPIPGAFCYSNLLDVKIAGKPVLSNLL